MSSWLQHRLAKQYIAAPFPKSQKLAHLCRAKQYNSCINGFTLQFMFHCHWFFAATPGSFSNQSSVQFNIRSRCSNIYTWDIHSWIFRCGNNKIDQNWISFPRAKDRNEPRPQDPSHGQRTKHALSFQSSSELQFLFASWSLRAKVGPS